MAEVRLTKGFQDDILAVSSDRVLSELLHVVELLEVAPNMGSANLPDSIRTRFGNKVRIIPVNLFDIITEYDDSEDVVAVLALVHQKMAR